MTNQNYGIRGGSALMELCAMRFGFDGKKIDYWGGAEEKKRPISYYERIRNKMRKLLIIAVILSFTSHAQSLLCINFKEKECYLINDRIAINKIERIGEHHTRYLCGNALLLRFYLLFGNQISKSFEILEDCTECEHPSNDTSYKQVIALKDATWKGIDVFNIHANRPFYSKIACIPSPPFSFAYGMSTYSAVTTVIIDFADPDTLYYSKLKDLLPESILRQFYKFRRNYKTSMGKGMEAHLFYNYPGILAVNSHNSHIVEHALQGALVRDSSSLRAIFPLEFQCECILADSAILKYGTIRCEKPDTIPFIAFGENLRKNTITQYFKKAEGIVAVGKLTF
jgi:hypothetical protein